MRESIVEKAWITKSGLAAVVILTDLGHRCGYVAVRPNHSLHGVSYSDDTFALLPPAPSTPVGKRGVITLIKASLSDVIQRSPEMVFDVHGGLTYSGRGVVPQIDKQLARYDLWWFGYDCAHAGDAASPEYTAKMKAQYPDKEFMWGFRDGVHRTHSYCVAECESLAYQIKTKTVAPWRAWLRKVFHNIRTWKS